MPQKKLIELSEKYIKHGKCPVCGGILENKDDWLNRYCVASQKYVIDCIEFDHWFHTKTQPGEKDGVICPIHGHMV